MRAKFFKWLGHVTCYRYWQVLFVGLVVTLILGWFASQIMVEVTWFSMLPRENESVKSFERIIDEFGEATNIVLAVEGKSQEAVMAAVDSVVPALANIVIEYETYDGRTVRTEAIKRVNHQYDIDFVREHGFMLEKEKNLKKNLPMFTDYNLVPFLTHVNDVYEEQWVYDSDNLTKQEKDAERSLDGLFDLFHTIAVSATGVTDSALVQAGVDALTLGDGYYLSSDKKMALVFITPTGSINDVEQVVATVDSIDARLSLVGEKLSDVSFGITGMHVVMRDEMAAGITDTVRNLGIAIILILAIFVLSFRMWTGPLLAMIVLILGVTWDIGLAQLFYGKLNIITAVCSVILIGLGIDYALHIISSYTELRHKGHEIEQAMTLAFEKIGNGLITGALTTAIAFLSIATVSSEAFEEFGVVVGSGIVCCLLVSLFLLPSMIVAKDKLWQRFCSKGIPRAIDMEFRFLGRIADVTTAKPWLTIAIALVVTVFLGLYVGDARMNSNYMDLEPEGLESIRLQREIPRRFHTSPDNMMAVYGTIEEVNEIQDKLNSKPSVGMVESIATVLPSDEKQARRLPIVERIHRLQDSLPRESALDLALLKEQLLRLNDNIIEMSSMAYTSGLDRVFDKTNGFVGLDEEGNQVGTNYVEELLAYLESHPDAVDGLRGFQNDFRPIMKARVKEMSNTEKITIDNVPREDRDRYVSEDGRSYLMSFSSKKDVWEGLFTSPFLGTILRHVPGATGSPVFMKELVEARGKDGLFAFGIALLAIIVFLLWDFKSIRTTLIALVPLLMSSVWLFGLMGLIGIEFTIINVIGFPLLIGIGIDDGVHVIHRYRVEGKLKLSYSIASIGKAILLTSITTMLGFGSLMSSDYRGYVGLGLLVMLGIGLCFVTSVIVLPAIMKIAWGGKKENRRFFTGATQ